MSKREIIFRARRKDNGEWVEGNYHQTNSSWAPNVTPTLWKSEVPNGIPVWVQPTGAHDAYMVGEKVHFPTINDPIYEILINNNVWSPTVYPAGWQLD